MNFKVNKGPFLRNKRSTTSIMIELFVVLAVIWLVSMSWYIYGGNLMAGLRVFGIGAVSLLVTILTDVVVALIKGKRKIKDIFKFVLKSYSYVTALIFALCLPAGTSFYVVVLGALFATIIGKYVFGGFGNNIFNPAIIGRIFVGVTFPLQLKSIVTTGTEVDTIMSSTIMGKINWGEGFSLEAIDTDIPQLLLGSYQGAIGETFTILLLIAGIYLIIRGIVNYRLMFGYLLTAVLCSLGIGLVNGVSNIGEYLLTTISTGGLMFAAVFMITDPVTSPKSPDGKILYACIAGFLAIFIRVFSGYPEGVMFSIALANMICPLIDQSFRANTFTKVKRRYLVIAGVIALCVGISSGYAALPIHKEPMAQLFEMNGGADYE